MADDDRTPEQALNDALGYEPEVEETPTPEPEVEPAPEADPPKYTVAGKSYRDEDELVKALEHANTLISQRQPEPEPEPEIEERDPWEHIPGIPQERKNDLYKHAQENPLEAGKWAWENREALPREIYSQVIAFAQANDPAGWEEYRYDLSVKAAREIANEATNRFAEAEAQNIGKSAEATLRSELGDAYDTYEPLINQRIVAGQYVAPPKGTPTEQAVLQVFRQVYKDIWVEQNWDALQSVLNPQAAAAPAAAAPAPSAAVTAKPGAAAPVAATPDDEMQAALNRALGL